MKISMPQPYQIRLVVNRDGQGYSARWIAPDEQETGQFPLLLPLSAEDAERLRWYLETYFQFPGAGDHARARAVEAQFATWGQALFGALFGTTEGTHIYRSLMEAADDGRPCTITIGADEPEILVQPWEMIRDKHGPLAFQGVTIRRQLTRIGRPRRSKLSLPLRVLLIVSRPKDISFIDPRNSIAPLLDALQALPPGQFELDQCDPPTLKQLEQLISQARKDKRPYQIVHFDGHGTYLPRTGIGALAFERDDATTQLVTGAELGDLLARQHVPLVLLEACRSAGLSDKPVFGSLAPALLDRGVGSVLAFSHSVHIKAAQILVQRFYAELADGLTIGAALQESRAALHADRRRWLHLGPDAESVELQDWFIPQLYQVGPDPSLFKRPNNKPATPSPLHPFTPSPLHGFPPEPMYRFQGRRLEQLELERAFRRHRAVLLSGMGGMGKTALAREAAAWWLRSGRFEAAVFCSFEQRAGAERVVQLLGQALEGEAFSARPAEGQWSAAVELFHKRRVLLVWDNFESTLPIYQQGEESLLSFGAEARAALHRLYRELTAGEPLGRLLVTCRPEETGLPGIKELALHGLARPDSLHLLAAALDLKGIKTDRPGYERWEIEALLDLLDNHPLSIELVTPHLKTLAPRKIRDEFGTLLKGFENASAPEGRNRSLLASLEFSKRRLSPAAQQALPYLAWFAGGTFEASLLAFSELTPQTWAAIRAELVATALVSVEELEQFTTPYLRFHPTLPYAARPTDVPDPAAAEERFIAVYLNVGSTADTALRGRQPAAGMALLAREEANLRAAISRTFGRDERQQAGAMANTLREYLERVGRLRERDALVQWVRAQMPEGGGLDIAACNAILDHARSRLGQGYAAEAIQAVRELIIRLESEGLAGGADPAFQVALSYTHLEQIYVLVNRPDLAVASAHKAIALIERLPGDAARGNLSAALGDLANAYRMLGQFDAALEAAERGLTIERVLGRDREIAASLGRIADILKEQQRYAEANARYAEALRAAQAAGDLGLQGVLLQHQGSLQDNLGNHNRAIELYKQAIDRFQRANDLGSEMRTCDLLAGAETQRGQLDAAAAWYDRSRELALRLNDQYHLGVVTHNVGILYQTRAEQAAELATRAALLHQAIVSIEESLAVWLETGNQVNTAASYFQLGVLRRMLGELNQAETYTLQSLQIYESLNLPEVYKVYANLAAIARDRGDAETAARWQAKYEAKIAELKRLRRGPGGGPSEEEIRQLRDFILKLAQAAYTARASKTTLPPDAAEALAQLAQAPPPLGAVGPFLREIAAGGAIPPLPVGLPPLIAELLEALVGALGK